MTQHSTQRCRPRHTCTACRMKCTQSTTSGGAGVAGGLHRARGSHRHPASCLPPGGLRISCDTPAGSSVWWWLMMSNMKRVESHPMCRAYQIPFTLLPIYAESSTPYNNALLRLQRLFPCTRFGSLGGKLAVENRPSGLLCRLDVRTRDLAALTMRICSGENDPHNAIPALFANIALQVRLSRH